MSDPIRLLWCCDFTKVLITCDLQCHKLRPGYKGSLANDLGSLGGVKLPLRASQYSGVVTVAGWDTTGYGNMVKIAYLAGRLVVQTAHLDSIAVRVGQKVNAGDAIGIMGSTGNSSGTHTHFAVWLDGKNIDPLDPKNGIVMVNTVAELGGDVPPVVVPPVVTPPADFVLPVIPALPVYTPSAVITKWLNLRDAPNGHDVGDVFPGDKVIIFGYKQIGIDVWFAVRNGDQTGWCAALYNGEIWLEPVK